MRYLVILLSLFILTSCKVEKEYLYVNTIAISYDNEYKIDILKYEEDESIKGSEKGETIAEAITKLDDKIELTIGLNYISNIIIDVNSINDKVINDILNFVANSHDISLNFCVYATEDIDKLFDVRSINKISNSIFFVSPKKVDNILKLNYLDFAKQYKNNKSYEIPLIEISDIYGRETIYSQRYINN